MTATLEALGDRRGQPTTAVETSDGTSWSWPDLFEQFAPAIRSFARSRGVSNAEDIVQDVFAAAVERFPRFQGDTAGLRSFLFTVAYRRIADEHRITYRRHEQLVADHQPTADDSLDIEEAFTAREDASEAMRALAILGDRERQVIEMRIIDEASPAEVANALGLSNGNVRVIQARALMKIRKYLETRSGAMPSGAFVFAFLESLRSELPVDGAVAEWIEILHSESTEGSVKAAAAGAGSAIAAGTASVASVGSIAGSALKIALVVALATVSTSSSSPDGAGVADRQADLTGVVGSIVPMVDETAATGFTVPRAVLDEPAGGINGIAPNLPGSVTSPSSGAGAPAAETDEAPKVVEHEDAEAVDAPDGGGSPEPTVGEVVEPVVGEVVEPVVEDVVETVESVVEEVVDTVVEPVGTVVEDVVEPVVADVVEVVDDTTDTIETAVDDVDDVVDDVIDVVDLDDNPVGGFFSS